ncbi:kinase-like domain-containing protein [Rhizophagus irregularis DAOM 181602=DAOM 197198]|nr:kinase-like domain-containing protein [Rhizophagus irregularis DAOM 181602=DAOM 197198]
MENLEINSRSWISGNEIIDDFIREIQLEINNSSEFKWVPYNQFSNIKKIGNGDFAVATWKHNQSDVTVNLKYLYNSQSITAYELHNEARQYSISRNTIYSALWNDGQLRYDQNKKEWTRVQVKINLKLFNSQNTIDEFLNKVVEYKNDNKFKKYAYGISQNPDTKDYILVLQDGYCEGDEFLNKVVEYKNNNNFNKYAYGISQNLDTKDYIFVLQDIYCKGCGENDIKKVGNIIYSALWNDGQLKYDQNKKGWTKVQVKINLKLFNSQNTIDEFLNKVVEYKNDNNFKIDVYGISQNPDTKDYILVLQDGYCEGCALWNDGQLKYNRNKKEWTRRVQIGINLKLFNSQNTVDEFLNKAAEYKNDNVKIYGISQNPDTKDYILVLQTGCNCEECGEKYTETHRKCDIKKIGNIIYSALWNDGQLKYDQNKKEWTRVQVKINLKLFNSQNTIDAFLDKVVEYKNDDFKIYGISQNPDTKDYIFVLQTYCEECALWKVGPLKYNQDKEEWARTQFIRVILKLCNSQCLVDEFLNKIKVYENALWKNGPLKYNLSEKKWARVRAKEVTLKLLDSQNKINNFLNKIIVYKSDENFEIYGISQNPDTKDYVLVSQSGYCQECDEKYTEIQNKWSLWNNGPLEYESNKKKWVRVQANKEVTLKLCNTKNMINGFLNKVEIYNNYFKIHGIARKPDSKDYIMVFKNYHKGYVKSYCEICIEEYTDIKCKGGFATAYSAKWKNGPLHYDKEWKRGPYKKVALKLLNKSHDIIDEILKEIKAYSMNKCATGRQPFSDHAHDKVLALGICSGIRPKLNELEAPNCYVELMERCWDSVPDNRPNAIEIIDIIYSYNLGLNGEINKQFKEAEEYRKVNISSIEINQSTTHPQASNISRLLNPFTKDLPKCDNNDDHSECLDCSIAD